MSTADTRTTSESPTSGAPVEVVRSEERLEVGTRLVETGRVRVSKRLVTEERTVTVLVRREELVVEHLPAAYDADADGADGTGREDAARGASPVLELVLSEERVETRLVVVPVERVRVSVERVAGVREVSADVSREVVDVVGTGRDERSAPNGS